MTNRSDPKIKAENVSCHQNVASWLAVLQELAGERTDAHVSVDFDIEPDQLCETNRQRCRECYQQENEYMKSAANLCRRNITCIESRVRGICSASGQKKLWPMPPCAVNSSSGVLVYSDQLCKVIS